MPSTAAPGLFLRPALILLAFLLTAATIRAESPPSGVVVEIPDDGIREVAGSVLTTVDRPRSDFDAWRKGPNGDLKARFTVICDFNPKDQPNRSDSFGDCYELAKKLRELQKQGVFTVAYVHGEVSRHSVLPVLVCSEIVMSRQPLGKIGPVTTVDRPLEKAEAELYEALAPGNIPLALVRKLYDPTVDLLERRNLAGDRYVDGSKPPRPEGTPVEGLGVGTLVTFTFDRDRDLTFGLVQAKPLNSLEAVLLEYGLSRNVLRKTPTKGVMCKTVLTGPVNGEMREKMQRRLQAARDFKATFLILEIACGDGDPDTAKRIADMLIDLGAGEQPIYTVAYVKPPARNLAMMLAFACDRILMHPNAKLGDFEGFLQAHPKRHADLAKWLPEIANRKHYPKVIASGMLDRDLVIHLVTPLIGAGNAGAPHFLDAAAFAADNKRWAIEQTIKPRNENERHHFLTLDAAAAQKYRLVESLADSIDQIAERNGIPPKQVRSLDGDLLERIADFLRDPWTSYILLMVGITCLILEIKIPGVTLPGVIAAVCFVLYFWSRSQVNGEIVWLALLLFALGLVLLAVELFVLPGFGVCGIGGVICILGALGLIGVGQIPRTGQDWMDFGNHLGYLLLGMFLAIVAAILIVQYLPHLPFVNHLLLKPGESQEERSEGALNPEEDPEELLGAIGVAATPLRPAGKMQFGERFLDVVAEGGYILPGTRLQIVEIEGNRIVVKEI